jgi:hypothetical protein
MRREEIKIAPLILMKLQPAQAATDQFSGEVKLSFTDRANE